MPVQEGVVFEKLRRIEGFLAIDFQGSTPPITDFSGSDLLQCRHGVVLQCSGTGPMLQTELVGPTDILAVFLIGSEIRNAGHEVIKLNNAGSIGFVGVDLHATIGKDSLAGVTSSLYSIQVTDVASQISWIHGNHAGQILPRYPWSQAKSGVIEASEFSGAPQTANVAFQVPYIDDQYHVSLTVEATNSAVFQPHLVSRVATGFEVS